MSLPIKLNFSSSLATACAIHIFVISVFFLTFPNPKAPARPIFIFLGSFLRPEDVVFSVEEKGFSEPGQMNSHQLNLDIRQGSLPRTSNKPRLTNKVVQPVKVQYKPVMNKDKNFSKGKQDEVDLGVDLAPFKPVRMSIERDDQN